MGFNSSLVIFNDNLNEIESDPEFGKKVYNIICNIGVGTPDDKYKFYHDNGYFGSGKVACVQHADTTQVIAVGDNDATLLGYAFYHKDPSTEEGQFQILKQLADKLGYNLHRKPNKRK